MNSYLADDSIHRKVKAANLGRTRTVKTPNQMHRHKGLNYSASMSPRELKFSRADSHKAVPRKLITRSNSPPAPSKPVQARSKFSAKYQTSL